MKIAMPEPFIEIASPDGTKQVPITDKPITVGRHPTNMVVLADGMTSRYHCVIELTPEGLRIRDLDSSNGTKVNGQVVKTWRLGDGDVVTVGKSTITVFAPTAAGAKRAGAVKPQRVPVPAEEDDYDVEVE